VPKMAQATLPVIPRKFTTVASANSALIEIAVSRVRPIMHRVRIAVR